MDFKEIFAKKVDCPHQYKLLEVYNPRSAKHVLDSDPNIGLLLPCTVAVCVQNEENFISLAKPPELLSVASNVELESREKEIETKFIQVIDDVK